MNIRQMRMGTLALLALSALGPAWGQDAQPLQITANAQGVVAQGHGEMRVKPDIALVTLTVTTQSADQAQAVRQNASKTTAVLAALRGASIASKDIQTQSYTVQPQYDYKPSPPLLTGYQVQNSVQATVCDLTKVGLVIDKTTAQGAEIGGVSFDLSDQAQFQSHALSLAIASAKAKAAVMADAAGVGLGRLLSITEGSSAPIVHPMYAVRTLAAPAPSPETPISDQQITISADATLVYAMGPAK